MNAGTVNPGLATETATVAVADNDSYAAFTRRIVRAYARRVAAGDVEALPALVALSSELDGCIQDAVDGLRAFGYSWAEIAARLGISRQGVWKRWAPTTQDSNRATAAGCDDTSTNEEGVGHER